jgi:hypothetical protein
LEEEIHMPSSHASMELWDGSREVITTPFECVSGAVRVPELPPPEVGVASTDLLAQAARVLATSQRYFGI